MAKRKRSNRKAKSRSNSPKVEALSSSPGDQRRRWWLIAVCGGMLIGAALWIRSSLPTATDEEETIAADGPLVVPVAESVADDDPSKDGWASEAFYLAAKKQLAKLSQAIAADDRNTSELESIVADFEGTSLVPSPREETRLAGGLLLVRGAIDSKTEHRGAAGLAEALAVLNKEFDGYQKRLEFKIDHVEMHGTDVDTHVRLILTATRAEGQPRVKQLNTRWHCRWNQAGSLPRIASLRVEQFELVESGSAAPLFVDCSPSALAENGCYQSQLLLGIDDWLARFPSSLRPVRWGDHGMALGDVNGDGLEDLYLCEPEGLPNRLFLREPNGRLTEHSNAAGVDWLDHSRGALLVDLDKDGDRDLAVSTRSALLLMSNDSQGNFKLESALAIAEAYSLSAADYDQDGDFDVYSCGYHADPETSNQYPLPIPYHNATNGGRNVLLRNDGDWKFSDVTQSVGLDRENHRWSLAAAWEDFDNDGDQDLYVANDFGPNVLYRNDYARFTDITTSAKVRDVGSGMSVAWGDYDHDGRMDLYISNMYSTAGGRVTGQDQFQPQADAAQRSEFARLAKGNTLFKNVGGDDGFEDTSEAAEVAMGRWAWGAAFADLNNDSWEDLLVANGFVTRDNNHDL